MLFSSVRVFCSGEFMISNEDSMKQNKRIHIQIKGNHEEYARELMADLAFEQGLQGYTNNSQSDVLEIVAEGEKGKLFELVKKITSTKFHAGVEEIVFFFKEADIPNLRIA
ncbi:MAG: acylphosphatase [Patescibacteria group bacterium]